jgi:hypothetical protein
MMRSCDPVRFWNRCTSAGAVAMVIGLGMAAWWAIVLVPSSGDHHTLPPWPPAFEPPASVEERATPRIRDPEAFHINLWPTMEPTEPRGDEPAPIADGEAAMPEASATERRLTLVGIIEHHDALRAAIYDADQDRLHIVESGTTVGRYRVATISRRGVRLSIGESSIELTLKEAAQ